LAGTFLSEFVLAGDALIPASKNDNQLMQKLIYNNDQSVKDLIAKGPLNPDIRLNNFRPLATSIAVISASASNSGSAHYRSAVLSERLNQRMDIILKGQYSDGTVDAGGNRQSPPDTAFVLEHICLAATVLKLDGHKDLQPVTEKLKKFILSAGEAMVNGGVHTPNHRWVISAALANINALYPDAKYVHRIDEWLSEGIYLNEDGHFLERSSTYSAVIDKAFITMARLLNRPELLDPVHKNLTTYYYYTELNGDVVSVDSRRQDQFSTSRITRFYLQYRYMAIITGNPLFTEIARKIGSLPEFKDQVMAHSLAAFMENKELQKELPDSGDPDDDFEKLFTHSNLARIRRGNISVTIFGGNDKPIQVISGRSSNPNFLSFRKGKAILKYMRLSTSFFRMGYFSSDGLIKEGRTYRLKERKEAYYYQPLDKNSVQGNGDYRLSASPDGRFWNKMDFDSRKKSDVKEQITAIDITETDGVLDIDIKVTGPPNVEVTLEMCFNEMGKLTGVVPASNNNYFLESGSGSYTLGEDVVHFGPGKNEHKKISRLESEQYTYHQGSLRTAGLYVYLTGYTPFSHKITLG